ncbi:MAG: hypothetical protein LUE29_09840 [Lachnospiraceae bacterium]|nr:hypothetical protein [Lachnospiraceae bacterium]
MKSFLTRLTSRKFIASMLGVILGIAVTFGVDGSTVTNVMGIITSAASIVSYIITEGKVDAASVGNIIDYIEVAEEESEAE